MPPRRTHAEQKMKKEFELARLHIITSRFDMIEISRLFAWCHRIYPLYPDVIEETFKDDFEISGNDVYKVLSFVNDKIKSEGPVSFYTIEYNFSGAFSRFQLINILRLAFIDGRFDSEFWNQLSKNGNGPIEAHGICDEFDFKKDIHV